MILDDKKIDEIVARVVERLGGAPTAAPHRVPVGPEPVRKANIPRGTNGVFTDPEQAVKAARKAFELNERTPVATRAKMVVPGRAAASASSLSSASR